MKLHSWEAFGFAGQAVSGLLFLFTDYAHVATAISIMAAGPLFVGQHLRHRTEDEDQRNT